MTRHTITAAEAVNLLSQIRAIVYERCTYTFAERLLSPAGERVMDPSTELDSETCEYVAGVFEDAGLAPEAIEAPQPLELIP